VCGICGVVDLRGQRLPVSAAVLDSMTDSMTHRGPNDRGTLLEPGVALGVRRLSIIDVAGGHQPVSNEDGTVWAVQNGELYNHDQVREGLRAEGHSFDSRCDTEILPHLYEREGVRFAEQVHGKFGIAVWDGRRRRAVVARDRLGVKPLYYAVENDFLVFGSELKAVLASGLVPTDLDFDAIDAYLTFGFTPGPATPLRAVRKLLPGHRLVAESGRVSVEPYWRYPEPASADRRLSEAEYAEGLMERLDLAVRRRLMSDVPVGAMLSGGIDSSLIVALMAAHSSKPVETFSIGFTEAGRDMELEDARSVARLFGANHHELELSFDEAVVGLPELLWHLDEPMFDISSIGLFALSKLAARHVTVALSGQGADELLGGYKKHRAAAIVDMWSRLPRPLRSAVLAGGRHLPRGAERALATLGAGNDVERLIAMSGRVDPGLRELLYRGPLAATEGDAARRAVLERLPSGAAGALATTLHVDGTLALVDVMLHYFDRVSMAHSLEVRVPFLDHELVEYCAAIPPDLKVRRLATKYLLKRAAKDLLPLQIVHKRKLGFFRPAAAGWLASQLEGEGGAYLVARHPLFEEFVARRHVLELVQQYRAGDRRHVFLLTSLMMLEAWLQTYLVRATEVPSAPAALAR
jgi:asparagine synthase (glutamine-hydrolysing)